ncbi:CoF synthetase [Acidianus sulfidivorans JP7]|uniref:CoF synthetase n=2 Tax=Acidianus TaxID=12914 RepID=A0A2U9INC3_9CREN|nr:adenosylcobinamide amidohydrolase [Acidianus sulfidivorans]AWR97496.1 CoF synthetase [Acidianus sulfidivorans JP7]
MRRIIVELENEYLTLTSALYPEGINKIKKIAIIFVDKTYCSKNPWKDAITFCPNCEDAVIFLTAAEKYAIKRFDWGILIMSAGIGISGEDAGCTINIAVLVDRGLAINGLVDLIRTVTEAKSGALRDLSYKLTGTVSDAIAVGSLIGNEYFIGPGTELGKIISKKVKNTLIELLS